MAKRRQSAGSTALDRARSELLSAPVKAFTRRRSELVAELRKQGEDEAAAALARVRKPPPQGWAAQALAREAPDVIHEVFEAADAAMQAQRRALAGERGDKMRDATRALHEAIANAVQRGAELLQASGSASSAATLNRLRELLFTIATSEGDERKELERGELAAPRSKAQAATSRSTTAARAGRSKKAARPPKRDLQREREERRAFAREEREKKQQQARVERSLRSAEHRYTVLDREAELAEARAIAKRHEADVARRELQRVRQELEPRHV